MRCFLPVVTFALAFALSLANNRVRAKTIDGGMVADHATRDVSHRSVAHGDPIGIGGAARPAARGACPAPPVGRPGAVESAVPRTRRVGCGCSCAGCGRNGEMCCGWFSRHRGRWHRDRFDWHWWRRSRRPGRPRIDSQVRDLIRRVADENRLWRAPRIHGELPKLGIVVSERTVSRYLHGRPRTPSQTWRTFLANHLGQIAYISEFPSLNESGDGVVDALAEAWRATASPHCDVRRRNARWSMCPRRFDAQMSAAISPRITFATARACRGAAGRSPPPDARAVPYSTHHRRTARSYQHRNIKNCSGIQNSPWTPSIELESGGAARI